MVSNSLHGRYWHACKHLRTAHQAVVELWKVWYKQKNALDCIALRNSFYFASKYSSVSVWSTLCSSTMAAVCRAVGIYHANYKELWESGSFQRCFFFFVFLVQCPLYPVLPKFAQHYPATTSQPVCQYTLFPNDQRLPGGLQPVSRLLWPRPPFSQHSYWLFLFNKLVRISLKNDILKNCKRPLCPDETKTETLQGS